MNLMPGRFHVDDWFWRFGRWELPQRVHVPNKGFRL